MSEQTTLERSYRRILAWYPRSFRDGSEEEILAVLLDTAREGRKRVGLNEAWDLVRGGLRMRLWPAMPRPRAVRAAVTLMLAGAVAELAALITVLTTLGRVRAAVAVRDPAAVSAAMAHLVAGIALGPLAVGLWLCLAWANGRGQDWARLVSAACFALITLTMLGDLAQNAAASAPADMVAAAVVWFLGLMSVALIFTPAAGRYYRPQPARQ
jgi:hypothetical protein